MKRVLWLAGIVGGIGLVTPTPALAHPLGNFTVNRFSELEVSGPRLTVRYAVDLAEVPTFQESAKIDADEDGTSSSAELAAYARDKAAFIAGGLSVVVDDSPVRVTVQGQEAALHRGDGGLNTMRLDVRLSAPLPASASVLRYEDLNFSSFPGWKEVIASGDISSADVPRVSISKGLLAYPKDAWRATPTVTTARLQLGTPAGAAAVAPVPRGTEAGPSARLFGERFAGLIERDMNAASVAIALLLAIGFGAIHAIGPGHGKTVMAAYLIGEGSKLRHAVGVGAAVAAMHTASVVALGLVTLWLASLFPAASVYPWLTLVSGVAIVGLGAWLFTVRWRARRAPEHTHTHVAPMSKRGLAAIALSGGLVPSPTAVVVLLGSVALHRVGFGIALVAGFSIGLAGALSAVGIAVLRARSFAERRWNVGTRSILPAASSAGMFAVGCFLTVRAALVIAT